MGKPGGSSGPAIPGAPDLSGNVKSANAITDTATSQANQTFNTAQTYNKAAQENLNNITGSQTPLMNNVANAANQNLANYGSTFAPLQAKQAQDAASYGSEANVSKLQGMAMADQAAGADAARKNSAAALASEGVDPASIHGGALDAQAALTAGKNIAGAGTQSALQTENTGRQLVNQANQLGLQVNAAGNAGAQTGAGVASSLAGDVNSTNSTGIQNLTADTAQLNTGVNANKSASDIASQAFNNQMTSYNAANAAASSQSGAMGGLMGAAGGLMGGGGGGGLGSMVSTLAPLAMMAMADGGVVPGSVDGIDHGSMARGGVVNGMGALPWGPAPGHPTDTKPALLTPGEYVIPKDVALHKGHEFFHKMVDKARVDMADRQAIPHAPSVGV